MSQLTEKLTQFGLNETESKIYLYLLASDKPKSILTISKDLGISRTSIYDISQKMIEKGFLERVIKHKSQELKASKLDRFEDVIKKEEKRISTLKEDLNYLKSNIQSLVNQPSHTEVRYFHGIQGLKQIMRNAISVPDRYICGYSLIEVQNLVGMDFLEEYSILEKQRNIKEQYIFNPTEKAVKAMKTWREFMVNTGLSKSKNTENIKYVDESIFNITGDVYIYDNTYAAFYFRGNDIFGFEIDNPELVEMQKSMFKFHWEIAKPISDLLD